MKQEAFLLRVLFPLIMVKKKNPEATPLPPIAEVEGGLVMGIWFVGETDPETE